MACLLIALVTLAVYGWNLSAPFAFDDANAVEGHPLVQRGEVDELLLHGGTRRIALASFALNRRLTGAAPIGFRITNVAIHALAGMLLFDLVRLTLLRLQWTERRALGVALIAAVAWVVHPLATQAVTYIVQRMESLAALFYLAALWSLARSSVAVRPSAWLMFGAAVCWLGAWTKETLLTLPVVALLYDRAFLAGGLREIWRKRWPFYVAASAASAWIVVQSSALFAPPERPDQVSAGLHLQQVTPWEYLRTQSLVILHYLRLAIAPVGQSFDYGWPVAESVALWLPALLVVGALALLTAYAAWRWPAVGFLPAAFFLILAPTSSLVPVLDLAVEHRMYLPLAAVVTAIAVGIAAVWEKFVEPRRGVRLRCVLPSAVAGGAIALLTATAIARNEVYRTSVALWRDVVAKSPQHGRGHYFLALALAKAGEPATAVQQFRAARALDDRYDEVDALIAESLFRSGQPQPARGLCAAILRDDPRRAAAHTICGMLDEAEGKMTAAHEHYARAVELDPRDASARSSFAGLLIARGEFNAAAIQLDAALAVDERHAGALAQRAAWHAAQREYDAACVWYRRALAERNGDAGLWCNYGQALFFAGRLNDAREALDRVLEIDAENAPAYNALGNVCAARGDAVAAEAAYRRAIAIQPQSAEAQLNLGNLLGRQRPAAARQAYETALAIDPKFVEAHVRLATLLAEAQPQISQQHLRRAIEIDPRSAQAYFQLANLHLLHGREREAIAEYRRALVADPGFAPAREALVALAAQSH